MKIVDEDAVPDDAVIVTMPVAVMPVPPVPSFQTTCTDCGQAVWVSEINRALLATRIAVCLPCVTERIAAEEGPHEFYTTSNVLDEVDDALHPFPPNQRPN